jgi:uncharacterized protein (TIGR02099 family)
MSSTPSPGPAPDAAPLRRWRRLRSVWRWTAGLILAAWSLILAAWLTLHWGILPQLEEWRPQIERRAGAALGVPVRIGAISVRSAGWVPAFELADVRLLDAQGRVALRLARVAAALSPASLLALEPRFAQLLIDDAQLDVRRDAQGRLHVAGFGLDLDANAGGEPVGVDALDWFFEQQEFVIRNGTLRWTDEQRAAPPLQLGGVDLVLRNGPRRHELRIDATPPAGWGGRFSLRGRFTQSLLARSGDFTRWSGAVYAELPRVDVAALGRHVSLPFSVEAGDGALRAWLDIEQGQPRDLTLDLALNALAVRLGPALEPLALADVSGRLHARRDEKGITLQARDFGFATPDGQRWPAGALSLAWQQAQDLALADTARHPVQGGEFSAERLDLAQMAGIAGRLPLPAALHESLQALAPRGLAEGLSVRWSGAPEAPRQWRAQGRLSGLALAAAPAPAPDDPASAPRRPGFDNAELDFQAHERGGQARLSMLDGTLEFPGVFAEPRLPMARLAADLAWRVTPGRDAGAPPALEIEVRDARFDGGDLRGLAQARWQTGAGSGFGRGGRFPGRLELEGRLDEAPAQRVARHLPLQLGDDVRRWVGRAVLGGRIAGADFRVKGDIWDFPFTDAARGEFRIDSRIEDLMLAYLPSVPAGDDEPAWDSPWPPLTRVAGRLAFERGAMHLRDASGQLGGFELRGVHGGIADLAQPRLELEGQGRGPAADLLRFVNSTPVGEWIGGGLTETSAGGGAELQLALTIPLAQAQGTRVRGSVTLGGGDLRLGPGLPLLAAARGRVDFSEQGFEVVAGRARAAGGDLAFSGGTRADGVLRFSGQGQAAIEALRREPAWREMLAPWLAHAHGQAAYELQLALHDGRAEWTLASPLQGVRIELPAPLTKPAEAAWPLRVHSRAGADGAPHRLQVDLGELLHLHLQQRDPSPGGDATPLMRAALGIGAEAPPLPAAGLAATLQLARLDVDAWRAAAGRATAAAAAAAGSNGSAAQQPAGAREGLEAFLSDRMPVRASVRAEDTSIGGRRLRALALELDRRAQAAGAPLWHARVDADQLAGDIQVHATHDGAGHVRARLSRLTLPALEPALVDEWLESAPATVPALDIVIEDFESRGRKLGRVEIEAVNRGARDLAGIAAGLRAPQPPREWQLSRLRVSTPEAELQASGRWAPGAGRRMALDFRLELADSGAFVERLGAGRVLRGGKGTIAGALSWAGSPLAPDPASMDGQIELALAAGQVLNADPGAARLLGLLSLQALPRLLALDFRDLSPPCRWCPRPTGRNRDAAARLVRRGRRRSRRPRHPLVALPEYFCLMGRRDDDKLRAGRSAGRRADPAARFLADAGARRRTGVWLVGGTLPLRSGTRTPGRVLQPLLRLRARRHAGRALRQDPPLRLRQRPRELRRRPRAARRQRAGGAAGRRAARGPVGLLRPALPRAVPRADAPALRRCLRAGGLHLHHRPAHWELLLRARAVENQCYVLAAGAGRHARERPPHLGPQHGRRPLGRGAGVLPEGEGVVVADLDPARIAEVRTQLPALAHRRLLNGDPAPRGG